MPRRDRRPPRRRPPRSPPTSSCRPPTCTTPRRRCCRPALQTYPEKWWAQAHAEPRRAPAAARRRGRRCPSSPTTRCCSPRTGASNFDDIFGASPAASPIPPRCTSAARARRIRRVAPAGHENLFVLVPDARRSRLGRGGIDGDGDAAVETAADRVIAQIARVVRHPRSRRPHRRAPHGRARRLRRRPARLARQRARPRAHPRPERGVPAAQRVAEGRGLSYAGASALPGIGLPMCLISAELVAQAPARRPHRPGPLPEPAEGVTMPGLYLARDPRLRRRRSPRSTRGGASPRGARRAAPRPRSAIGTAFFLVWDAVGIATGVFVKGDSPAAARHRPRAAAARSRSPSSSRSSAISRSSRGRGALRVLARRSRADARTRRGGAPRMTYPLIVLPFVAVTRRRRRSPPLRGPRFGQRMAASALAAAVLRRPDGRLRQPDDRRRPVHLSRTSTSAGCASASRRSRTSRTRCARRSSSPRSSRCCPIPRPASGARA